ncbi:MAG: hypothetical protein KY475_25930 [Planctomycetes bacterium]|nr:hypothetical protein [Planctomycetota bacterium]
MATAEPLPIYDELLDLLAESVDRNRLMAFRLPPDRQARLDALLQKNREGGLSDAERGELAEFERLEHLGRMLKARARQKQP